MALRLIIGRSFTLAFIVASVVVVPAAAGGGAPAGDTPGEPGVESLRQLLVEERFEEIERSARAVLAGLDARGRAESRAALDLLNLAVDAALSRDGGELEPIREDAAKALRIATRLHGEADPHTVLALWNLARVSLRAGERDGAVELLERALAEAEAIGRAGELLAADVLRELAQRCTDNGDVERATRLLGRRLEIQQSHLGSDHGALAPTLLSLARAHRMGTRYDEARLVIERARKIAERAPGPPSELLARILCEQGFLLQNTGNPVEAVPLFKRSVEIAEARLGPAHSFVCLALIGLGAALRDSGDLDGAETTLRRTLAIQQQLPEPSRKRRMRETLYTLSLVLKFKGELVEARRTTEQMISLVRETYGPVSMVLAVRLLAYINLLRDMNLLEEAKTATEEAIGIVRANEASPAWQAMMHLTLALVMLEMGDPQGFHELYDEWYPVMENELGPESTDTLVARHYRAIAFVAQGRHESAREQLAELLPVQQRVLGPEARRVTNTMAELGRLELRAGNAERAATLFRGSVEGRRSFFGEDSLPVAASLVGLAAAEARLGRFASALDDALSAERIGMEQLRVVARAFSEREGLAYASVTVRGLDLALSLASSGAVEDPASLERVFDAVIRSRAVVLDELASRHLAALRADDAETQALIEELSRARTALAQLVVRGSADDPGPHYRARLERARTRKEQAERAIGERSDSFGRELHVRRSGYEEVSAALAGGEALVSYARFSTAGLEPEALSSSASSRGAGGVPAYVAIVLASPDARPKPVALGPAREIDRAVAEWRREATKPPGPVKTAAAQSERRYRVAAGRLRELVWDPLESHIGDARRVFVVPDGALHLVNFSTLPAGDGRYLLDTGPQLQYLTVERELVQRRRPARGRGLLAVGGASFDASPGAIEAARAGVPVGVFDETSSAGGALRGARSECDSFEALSFAPLPDSRIEVGEVVASWHSGPEDGSFGGADVVQLIGKAAHEAAFKALAPGRRVVHLATHGFFVGEACRSLLDASGGGSRGDLRPVVARRPGENPLLLSGLALAGANRRRDADASDEDGILTAEEIASLDLSEVEWVVLSACNTGVGPTTTGEGVFGLRRAVALAGARTLIMSLWAVDDRATREFMRELYRVRGDGLDAAAATRGASLAVLERRRRAGEDTHPFHWGAFVPVR